MLAIRYNVRNPDGKLLPVKYKKYNTNDEALQFYINNKQKLRDKGYFIELVTLKERK